jgi:putative aldouronate transport system substrate-binding protein
MIGKRHFLKKMSSGTGIVLVGLLAILNLGCGKNSGSGSSTVTGSADDGPLTPYRETITVRMIKEFDPDTWFPEGENFGNNILFDFYKEKLNIKYDLIQEIERGQYQAKLNLMIASNDLPDIFYANASQVYRMAQAGQIQSLQNSYEKYGSDKVHKELDINNMMYFTPAGYNNEIYGLPCGEDFALTIPFVWVRQDWLDELGIKFDPRTNEDIYNLARAFIKSGKARYGIVTDDGSLPNTNNLTSMLRGLAHSKGLPVNIFVDDGNGSLIYTDIQPGMKELLKEINGLYREGILDKEFATKNNARATSDLAAGYAGIYIQPFAIRNQFTRTKQNFPGAEFQIFPVPAQKDGAYHVSAENTCFRWLVVNSNFKHPEAAVKTQNLWHELWQGDYAEYFHGTNLSDKYAQSGENFKLYAPFWFDPPLKNLRQGEVFPPAWTSRQRNIIASPETRKQYDRSVRYFDQGEKDLYTGWTNMHMFMMSFPTLKQVYKAPENTLFDKYAGPTTEIIANRKPLADQTRLEWIVKFIVGNASVDRDFDQYVKEWMDVGGREILEEANKWYRTQKK